MSGPTLPADFAPLRVEATRLTCDILNAWPGGAHLAPDVAVRRGMIDAHAALLADLSRPESRDFWARWLAERVGLDASGGVTWTPGPRGVSGRALWQLTAGGVTVFFADHVDEEDRRGMGNRAMGAPGISTEQDRAAALALAVTAVAGLALPGAT